MFYKFGLKLILYYYRIKLFFNKKTPVIIDYKKYCRDNDIDKIVELFYEKGAGAINTLPQECCVYIKSWNSKVVEIFSHEHKNNDVIALFKEEYRLISKLPNIDRALLMTVDPMSDVSEHLDDDDTTTYRILIGIHGNGTFTNVTKKQTEILNKNNSLGIDVEIELHKGRNSTADAWTMLILCIEKEVYRV